MSVKMEIPWEYFGVKDGVTIPKRDKTGWCNFSWELRLLNPQKLFGVLGSVMITLRKIKWGSAIQEFEWHLWKLSFLRVDLGVTKPIQKFKRHPPTEDQYLPQSILEDYIIRCCFAPPSVWNLGSSILATAAMVFPYIISWALSQIHFFQIQCLHSVDNFSSDFEFI